MNNIFPEIILIKKRRQMLGIKQKELANLSSVSQSMIAKIESGKITPSYDIVKRVFAVLENSQQKNEKKCSEVMSKKLIFLTPTSSVKKAIEVMRSNSISQLPIMQNGIVCGSLTESGIYNKIADGLSKEKIESMKIKDVMGEPFPIVSCDYPLSSILSLLKSSEAVLLTSGNKLAGIITKVDVI